MVDAVLAGDGLDRVAELAAEAVGGTVVIVVPRLGAAALAPRGAPASDRLPELRRYVGDCVADRPANPPRGLAVEIPIASGDEMVGCVLLLEGASAVVGEASEYLHLAAVASLTEVAVEEARDEVEQNLRGSFLEDLRAGAGLAPDELVRRAARLGCDLSRGAVALCAELHTDRPRHVVATIAEDVPGALAQHMESATGGSPSGRVYALLPAVGEDDAAEATLAAAARLATRLQRHGTVGLSSFYAEAGELGRAVQEAELVLDVLTVSGEPIAEDINQGTYRLLFRVLASHPEEVRSFYEDTVAPVVRYDDQYRTDLIGTLEAYLTANCHMSATAAAIHAHRHTVAYRLERVRDLTGLDPMQSEDRERLGLGLKAYRIIAPRLPR
ncbi:MAG: helix-turn-helix domain-containing protein [Solirubrobacteraceae bacterium]|nr:helix-turn-helix domain-containing protein [Solirubrobacteraceae bacterium]